MAGIERIAFIHLSDLHVGGRLLDNQHYRWPKSGYNVHDSLLLEPLRNAVLDIPTDLGIEVKGHLPVVVTGDLTAGGTRNDFAAVHALLTRRWPVRNSEPPEEIGFAWRQRLDEIIRIPGNHDHWGHDRLQRSFNPLLVPYFIPALPEAYELGGGRLRLQLFTIDSNPIPAPGRANWNLRAAGAFSKEVRDAFEQKVESAGDARELNSGGAFVVRAVLCHHAFDNTGIFLQVPAPLDTPSRNWLLRLATQPEAGLFAALTGHNHFAIKWRWPDPDGSGGWLREFRAAAALAGKASPKSNGFYVHEIRLGPAANAKPTWHVHEYAFDGSSGFDLKLKDDVGRSVG